MYILRVLITLDRHLVMTSVFRNSDFKRSIWLNANLESRHAVFTPSPSMARLKYLRLDLKNIGGFMERRSKPSRSVHGEMDWLQPAAEVTINAYISFTPLRVQP